MPAFTARRTLLIVVLAVVVGGGLAAAWQTSVLAPLRLATHTSWSALAQQAETMDRCTECHEAAHLHTCDTCHDDHGAIELADVPFYAAIALTGDVPEPGYVSIDDVLPYRDQPHTHVPLLDFLAEQGVTAFESVTLASTDDGFVTIERADLTSEAWLLPYEDGIRFAAENLHVSLWLKGVTRMIVVGAERPLQIDGQPTSMGRLLLGPTRSVTVEETDVMLKSEVDGQVRKGKTAGRVEGAAIDEIVANPGFQTLVVRDGSGQERVLTLEEAEGAVLAPVRGQATLVLPGRGRAQWVTDVVAVSTRK